MILWAMDITCIATFHANGCWVFRSRVGQWLLRRYL